MKNRKSANRKQKKFLSSSIFLVVLPICFAAQPLHHFPIGERLEYEAKFGFINLGNMVLEITDTITHQERLCYAISSRLNSSSDLHFIFSLSDTINVLTMVNGLLPISYEKRIHEGKYSNYHKLDFNQDSLFVMVNDSLRIEVNKPVMDLISFWYYLRCVPLIEDDTINLLIFEAKQEHWIKCIVGKKQVIKTPLGKLSTIRVTPQTKGKGVFGSSGTMDIWYTADENRLPVQIKTKLKFGTVVFKLKEVKY
jgi:hypothetical protein